MGQKPKREGFGRPGGEERAEETGASESGPRATCLIDTQVVVLKARKNQGKPACQRSKIEWEIGKLHCENVQASFRAVTSSGDKKIPDARCGRGLLLFRAFHRRLRLSSCLGPEPEVLEEARRRPAPPAGATVGAGGTNGTGAPATGLLPGN